MTDDKHFRALLTADEHCRLDHLDQKYRIARLEAAEARQRVQEEAEASTEEGVRVWGDLVARSITLTKGDKVYVVVRATKTSLWVTSSLEQRPIRITRDSGGFQWTQHGERSNYGALTFPLKDADAALEAWHVREDARVGR